MERMPAKKALKKPVTRATPRMRSSLQGVQATKEPSTREKLIEGVLAVIAEHGVEGLTHRRVGDAAGVPLGATTYYFASREDMLAAGMTTLEERDLRQAEARLKALVASEGL